MAPAKILCGLIGLMGAPLRSLICAPTIASFEFPRLAFLRLAAAANAMHDFALHDLPTAIYPADHPATFNIIIHGREVVRAAGMLIPELIRLAELADMLTKLKANDSTASKPETPERGAPWIYDFDLASPLSCSREQHYLCRPFT